MQRPRSLVIDVLASLKAGPRPHNEVVEAWKTSCPRPPVREDALHHGFVRHERNLVVLSEAGEIRLAAGS